MYKGCLCFWFSGLGRIKRDIQLGQFVPEIKEFILVVITPTLMEWSRNF